VTFSDDEIISAVSRGRLSVCRGNTMPRLPPPSGEPTHDWRFSRAPLAAVWFVAASGQPGTISATPAASRGTCDVCSWSPPRLPDGPLRAHHGSQGSAEAHISDADAAR
jgi:hypothetical protein